MSREIKVKAWHVTQKKMYSAEQLGKDQLTLSADGRGFVNVHGSDKELSRFYGDQMIPLEYAGLQDNSGKEICEGDILECGGFKRLVEWENGGFWADGETWGYGLAVDPLYHYLDGCGSHVIGNKYENSELLEAK